MSKRENFSSKLGVIFACMGAAIGLGNIWMFPWRLGQYGGAAFLIPYFIFVLLLGTTGLIIEFSLGRYKKNGSYYSIHSILSKKNIPCAKFISFIPTIAITGIFLFYSIVVGWILKYLLLSLINGIKDLNSAEAFGTFAGSFSSIPWHGLGVLITLAVIFMGVSKGIEKINKIMMPSLFVIFILLLIRSLTLPGALEGIKYLINPEWSYLANFETWIMALGQAFFTVSLTGAALVVYGSYIKDDVDIPTTAISTAIFDTLAALLAAFIIIPSAFALGIDSTAGPSLLFITVPEIFKSMPAGSLFSTLFFLSVLFAALSSSISMMEPPVDFVMNRFNISRKKSAILIAIICFIISIPLDINMDLFNSFSDFITIYLAPLGALIAAITFFWAINTTTALNEVNKGAKYKLGNFFVLIGKYIFPLVTIIVIILGSIYGGIG